MKKVLTAMAMLVLMTNITLAQNTLVGWTFPTGTSQDAVADQYSPLNRWFTLIAGGGFSAIDYSKNGYTTKAAQAINWDNGANVKYWMITFISSGYDSLKLSSRHQSGNTNPGPKSFRLQYRISSAGSWTDIPGGNITCANDWTTGWVNNLALPDTIADRNDTISIRWLLASDTAITGALLLPSGIAKIDDVFVTGKKLGSGIDMKMNEANVDIYPNPASDYLMISADGMNIKRIILTDGQGKKVIENIPFNRNSEIKISMPELSTGLYFVHIFGDNYSITKKLFLK